MNGIGLAIVAMGLFAFSGAAFDWNWFMNSSKARFFVMIFGRSGARVFYGLLGIVLVAVGLLVAFGIIQDSR